MNICNFWTNFEKRKHFLKKKKETKIEKQQNEKETKKNSKKEKEIVEKFTDSQKVHEFGKKLVNLRKC